MKRDREDSIAHQMRFCRHYDGRAIFMKPHCCRAGVKYDTLGTSKERPCIDGHLDETRRARCPKYERTTREESAASTDEMDRKTNNVLKVLPVVNAWRNKKKPYAKQGVIPCPVCGGSLQLSQSGFNGHVWGKCETDGCAEWME